MRNREISNIFIDKICLIDNDYVQRNKLINLIEDMTKINSNERPELDFLLNDVNKYPELFNRYNSLKIGKYEKNILEDYINIYNNTPVDIYKKEVKDDNKNECDEYAGFLGKNPEDIEAKKKEYETHCKEKNEEDGSCTRCDYGYELDTEKKCVLIGCKEYEKPSTKCKYCEHGYILVEDDTKCLAVSEALGESGESGNSGKLPNINYRLNILFLILLFFL